MKEFLYAIKYLNGISPKILWGSVLLRAFGSVFNTFYGVYFLRIILYNLEAEAPFFDSVLVIAMLMIIETVYWYAERYMHQNVFMPKMENRVNEKVLSDIFDSVKKIPYMEFNKPETLDKASRISENTAENLMKTVKAVAHILSVIVDVFMIGAYVLFIDPFALLISVVPIVAPIILGKFSSKFNFKLKEETSLPIRKKEYAKRIFYLPEYAKEIKLSKISEEVKRIYSEGTNEHIEKHKTIGVKIAFVSFLTSIFENAFNIFAAFIYMLIRVMMGAVYRYGDFLGIYNSITYFAWDIQWAGENVRNAMEAVPHIKEFREFIERDFDEGKIKDIGTKDYILELKDASFSYDGIGGKNIIDGIDLIINKGEKIAIVGENGAGKTTLVNLILGLYKPTSGRVTLNGVDVSDIYIEKRNEFFVSLFQDFNIYPFTVRENALMGLNGSDEEIIKGLEDLNLSEKLSDLNRGMTSEFDKNGYNLSGGQNQRLAFLRVLTSKGSFIILDEPTSALDPINEEKLYKLIGEKFREETILFISHKLCSTSFAEKIIFLEKGKKSEMGTHTELISKGGGYASLFNLQSTQYAKGTLAMEGGEVNE
ncbi:MAG: ABC transporter ATP-binding protein [Ruminococcaceae bacterium]|nr:ABC transporter ATP-binding protein [Oscillospiraceae bacterium]